MAAAHRFLGACRGRRRQRARGATCFAQDMQGEAGDEKSLAGKQGQWEAIALGYYIWLEGRHIEGNKCGCQMVKRCITVRQTRRNGMLFWLRRPAHVTSPAQMQPKLGPPASHNFTRLGGASCRSFARLWLGIRDRPAPTSNARNTAKHTMAPISLDRDDSDAEANYHESSDEDFNPAAAPADESSASSDEENAPAKPAKGRKKRKAALDDALDSGDEVTIEAARKRRAKKRKGAKDDEDDLLLSDDGEGGLIKTRAQRRVEYVWELLLDMPELLTFSTARQKERKPLARIDGATVDVDALWAQMSATPLKPIHAPEIQEADASGARDQSATTFAPAAVEEEEQVTVTKIYTFAGQRTTEEKQIPRSKLDEYLSDGWKATEPELEKTATEGQEAATEEEGPKVRRPLRRPSRFDANPTGLVRVLPPEHQLSWPRKATPTVPAGQENVHPLPEATKAGKPDKVQKLNVVDKSRLDWTGFVDKEGIAEELDTHGKTKEAYLGRMEFLAGVDARREEERRKLKTAAMS